MVKVRILLCVAIMLLAVSVPPASAMETRFLGEGAYPAFSMNASGQYAASLADYNNGGWRGIFGDLQSPLPEPFELTRSMADMSSVAVLPDGTTLFDWFNYVGKLNNNLKAPVTATLRLGSSSPEVTTLAPMRNVANDSTPKTAVSSTGGAFRVWTTMHGRKSTIWGSFRPSAGSFEPPHEIYSETTRSIIFYPQVKLDANNIPTIVWENSAATCGDRLFAISKAGHCKSLPATAYFTTGDGNGGFLPAQPFQGRRNCELDAFDEADSGAALVLMECLRRKGWLQVAAMRPAGGTFGLLNPFTKAHAYGVSDLDAKMLNDGRALVAWRDAEALKGKRGKVRDVIRVSTAVSGGGFSPSHAIAQSKAYDRDGDVTTGTLGLAASQSGQPYIAASLATGSQVQIAAIRPDLTLGPLLPLPSKAAEVTNFAVSDSGTGVALWWGDYRRDYEAPISLTRFTVPAP